MIETCIAEQNNNVKRYTHSKFTDLQENITNKGLQDIYSRSKICYGVFGEEACMN